MNKLFENIFEKAIKWLNRRSVQALTPLQRAKAFVVLRRLFKREIINAFLILLGVFSAAFGLKSFLLSNDFIDGGITGVSLLVSAVSGINISILIVVLNIPFIILGYTQIGRTFVIKTTLGILGLSICLATINFPILTEDKLLVSVFGGFFLGAGIGLTMRGGGVIDGTEVMAISFSKKTGLTIGDIILIVNIIIFSFAAWLLSFETALYSILAYLSASKTVDFIIEGIEEYTGVTIISAKNEELRLMITRNLGRGVTIYKGTRGYGQGVDIDILYTVITRLEVARLNTEIEKIDPAAFVIMNSIKDTKGGMIKKRVLH
ncbi:YitT family protein [Aurantibacillus circumpalustris]|uniref:YitT family protein n=1 Tax=Aurantibacillus circumpalustris TaxID=3036359 RepID=UPI00295C35A2|nr:YitT family protein [Aurantibacillus circumpalustris]